MSSKKLNEGFEYIDDKYLDIVEEEKTIMKAKNIFIKWGAIAACVSIIAISTIAISRFLVPKTDELGDGPPGDTIISEDDKRYVSPNELYVDASDLIASSEGKEELLVIINNITIGKYQAVYFKVDAVSSEKLEKSKGESIEGSVNAFYISGHNDLQYIIQKADDGTYGLFKFQSFESDEYPYGDVLELIYGVNSVDDIVSIFVEPANMDNTDAGKKVQDEIGRLTVTKAEDIKEIYEVVSAMICYGEDNWDMIDHGSNDSSMVESVRQGRYLTFNLANKSTIDGMKYTGASGMFYEYSGIAYNRLNDTDKKVVEGVIGINK